MRTPTASSRWLKCSIMLNCFLAARWLTLAVIFMTSFSWWLPMFIPPPFYVHKQFLYNCSYIINYDVLRLQVLTSASCFHSPFSCCFSFIFLFWRWHDLSAYCTTAHLVKAGVMTSIFFIFCLGLFGFGDAFSVCHCQICRPGHSLQVSCRLVSCDVNALF